jgi:hypothetical protein
MHAIESLVGLAYCREGVRKMLLLDIYWLIDRKCSPISISSSSFFGNIEIYGLIGRKLLLLDTFLILPLPNNRLV